MNCLWAMSLRTSLRQSLHLGLFWQPPGSDRPHLRGWLKVRGACGDRVNCLCVYLCDTIPLLLGGHNTIPLLLGGLGVPSTGRDDRPWGPGAACGRGQASPGPVHLQAVDGLTRPVCSELPSPGTLCPEILNPAALATPVLPPELCPGRGWVWQTP